MRLLVVTQAVDLDNPVLGFFHRWIEDLAGRFDGIVVICLFEGRHSLPANVEVFSLGKEKKEAYRVQYTQRFLALAWGLRGKYDNVFVHMNQEYILAACWLWKLLGKRVYLWRNHYVGGISTDIAAFFCTKIFCTSKYSYTAKFSKTVRMPIGIDTDTFKSTGNARLPNSILSFGRIAPSKRIDVLIDALRILKDEKITFTADVYGDALPQDQGYYDELKLKAESIVNVNFHRGVSNTDAPAIYGAHEIFVNCSKSGMYDKTIFEAAACGTIVLASSEDYAKVADSRLTFDGAAQDLAEKIKDILTLSSPEKEKLQKMGKELAEANNLQALGEKLIQEIL